MECDQHCSDSSHNADCSAYVTMCTKISLLKDAIREIKEIMRAKKDIRVVDIHWKDDVI